MKLNLPLTETPWETRNIGRPAYAVAPEFFDSPDFYLLEKSMKEVGEKSAHFFIHARFDKIHLGMAADFERLGFYFIETTLIPHVALKKSEILDQFEKEPHSFLPRRQLRAVPLFRTLNKSASFPTETLRLIAGESFSDDRFHLDKNCSKEAADRRFRYWIDDLLADAGVTFDILEIEKKIAAFMARRGNNLILAGFSNSEKNAGLGDFFWLSVCALLKKQGFAEASTLISTNNTGVLNLYARLGFRFRNPQYTFHFWK